jgi:hypothetical protein
MFQKKIETSALRDGNLLLLSSNGYFSGANSSMSASHESMMIITIVMNIRLERIFLIKKSKKEHQGH